MSKRLFSWALSNVSVPETWPLCKDSGSALVSALSLQKQGLYKSSCSNNKLVKTSFGITVHCCGFCAGTHRDCAVAGFAKIFLELEIAPPASSSVSLFPAKGSRDTMKREKREEYSPHPITQPFGREKGDTEDWAGNWFKEHSWCSG